MKTQQWICSDDNLSQIKKQSETNENPYNQSNRAMDACEIANFLASELFMHQVANHDLLGLEVLEPRQATTLETTVN